jgi:ureidoglycolate hydrolase
MRSVDQRKGGTMEIRAVELSEAALRGIGQLITPAKRVAPEPDAETSYFDTVDDLRLGAPCSAGIVEGRPRPKTLRRMERHLHTREALVALEGEAVACLAPPQEPGAAGLDGIVAVRVKTGQAFILEVGAWHGSPFPVGNQPARLLVIFRSGTGRTDLEFHDLPQAVEVRG